MGNGNHILVSDMMCRGNGINVIGEFHLVLSFFGETKVIEGVGTWFACARNSSHGAGGIQNSQHVWTETVIYRPQLT